jgi:hypothetical protein
MTGILQKVLVAVLVLACGPLAAQDGDHAELAASDIPPMSESKGHGLSGLLIGAAAGIAVGFGVAAASEYPLKEGGAFGVMLLGGGLGGRIRAGSRFRWVTP